MLKAPRAVQYALSAASTKLPSRGRWEGATSEGRSLNGRHPRCRFRTPHSIRDRALTICGANIGSWCARKKACLLALANKWAPRRGSERRPNDRAARRTGRRVAGSFGRQPTISGLRSSPDLRPRFFFRDRGVFQVRATRRVDVPCDGLWPGSLHRPDGAGASVARLGEQARRDRSCQG